MSSLLFLCEVVGFALVAYWTFINDQLGSKGGSKGLLRMIDAPAKPARASRQRAPKWRQNEREQAVSAAAGPRWARKSGAAEPSWKRRGKDSTPSWR